MSEPVDAPTARQTPTPGEAGQGALRQLLRQPVALGCLAFLALVTLVAVVGPIALPNVATQRAGDLSAGLQGPSWAHPFGTDVLGRDVLQRLLVGTRITAIGMVQALAVSLALGVPFGLLAGYLGGRVDAAMSRTADLVFSIPGIVIVLVVLSVFPQNMTAAMVAFGALASPAVFRVVRAETMSVRAELYIAAATVAGLSRSYIISRHVLPRIAGPIIIQASLLAAVALKVQTGLAFLGLVVPAPAPSWGGMVADGVAELFRQPWLIWPPGLAIALTIIALGLFADSLRDATTARWSPAASLQRHRPLSHQGQSRPGSAPVSSDHPDGSLLSIDGLRVTFASPTGTTAVLDDVTFDVRPGETVGLVGESGCGKSTVAMSILGLLAGTGRVDGGSVWFAGRDLTRLSQREMRRIRGREVGLISQEPMISLDPAFRVGHQVAETVRQHQRVSRRQARDQTIRLLEHVQLPAPEVVAMRYPHELSGGMAQRVAIARALAGKPRLLIADEPTTALDVTVQSEILDLLRELQESSGMAILLVTHDWGVVADVCDRAVVMYAGQVVEQADVVSMFRQPLHPYTDALLGANPQGLSQAETLAVIPGTVPKPGAWPLGCHFHPRCRLAIDACREAPITLEQPTDGRLTRCIRHSVLRGRQEEAIG